MIVASLVALILYNEQGHRNAYDASAAVVSKLKRIISQLGKTAVRGRQVGSDKRRCCSISVTKTAMNRENIRPLPTHVAGWLFITSASVCNVFTCKLSVCDSGRKHQKFSKARNLLPRKRMRSLSTAVVLLSFFFF